MQKNNEKIIIRGEDKTSDISSWVYDGRVVRVTFTNGKTYPYNPSNIKIVKSKVSSEEISRRFEFLKRIAQAVGLYDEEGNNILASRLEKISLQQNKSMLMNFLSGEDQFEKNTSTEKAIFPFGFNLSQKDSVLNALEHPLSIIEGPPGTGKTQTILNIIANAVIRDESVAVVSSNNSATANVLEKLETYNVNFIAAYLGNSQNKTQFIETQKNLPDMSDWKMSAIGRSTMSTSLNNLQNSICTMLTKKNELAAHKLELGKLNVEYEHFKTYCHYDYDFSLQYLKPSISSSALLALWMNCEKYTLHGKMPSKLKRFINYMLHGLIDRSFYVHRKKLHAYFYSAEPGLLIQLCQKRWYMTKIIELTQAITLIEEELDSYNFDQKMKEYTTLSMKLFYEHLSRKYAGRSRTKFELEDLWKKPEAFINEYPVILSTTYSLRNSLSTNTMYDYVIIDEASQVDIVTGALALSCAKKAVIVGDLKQLPNVVNKKDETNTDSLFSEYTFPESYRYRDHSLLLSMVEIFPKIPRVLLREHYRCHPKIIDFCNQKFYDNQLIILTEAKSNEDPLIIYKTVAGNHARRYLNQRQIDIIKSEVIPKLSYKDGNNEIGIVTPYRMQTEALQEAFKNTGIQADTVDKFQGREKDIIILSTVDNEITDFTDNANRLNVAITRAKDKLILVINDQDSLHDKNIGDLIKYIEYHNYDTVQSNVHSVFDFLYKNYRHERNAILANHKKISEYDSENLMYALIGGVLHKEPYEKYDVVSHVPLRMILQDMDRLNERERGYAENSLTHVDFLIYEKIGKNPCLVIEVDGAAFHKRGTKQGDRDMLKNEILAKYDLPLLRFRTDGSKEEERLMEALDHLSP